MDIEAINENVQLYFFIVWSPPSIVTCSNEGVEYSKRASEQYAIFYLVGKSNAIFFDGLTIWRLKVLTVQSCMVGSTIAFSQKKNSTGGLSPTLEALTNVDIQNQPKCKINFEL